MIKYRAKITLIAEYGDLTEDIQYLIEETLRKAGVMAHNVVIDEELTDMHAYRILKEHFILTSRQRDRLDSCVDLPKILSLVCRANGERADSPLWYSVKLLMHKNKIFNGIDG